MLWWQTYSKKLAIFIQFYYTKMFLLTTKLINHKNDLLMLETSLIQRYSQLNNKSMSDSCSYASKIKNLSSHKYRTLCLLPPPPQFSVWGKSTILYTTLVYNYWGILGDDLKQCYHLAMRHKYNIEITFFYYDISLLEMSLWRQSSWLFWNSLNEWHTSRNTSGYFTSLCEAFVTYQCIHIKIT